MQIGETLVKLSKQEPLSPQEQEELRLWGNQTQLANSFVAGLNNGGSDVFSNSIKANFGLAISVIYSKVLESNQTTITFEIPSNYTHLLFMGSARSTNAVSGYSAIGVQFNDDTGNNYNRQTVLTSGTTETFSDVVAGDYTDFGALMTSGAAAGKAGSFWGIIPHYRSSFFKSYFSCYVSPGTTESRINLYSSNWLSTDPIRKMLLFTTNDFLAGSVFSIYGLQ